MPSNRPEDGFSGLRPTEEQSTHCGTEPHCMVILLDYVEVILSSGHEMRTTGNYA
jgi:hypothetical protein